MKHASKVWFKVLLMAFAWLPSKAEDFCASNLDKKKTIVKNFKTTEKDNLLIDNQFGQVNVNLWDKNEVRVQIIVRADDSDEGRMQCLLDGISIVGKHVENQIVVQTVLNTAECKSQWTSNKSAVVQIDYDIMMPKDMPLTIKNKFGNTNIPVFRSMLTVDSKHGNFVAQELQGPKNDIDMAFGNAIIENISNGRMNMSFTHFNLKKGGIVVVNNRFGSFKVGEINDLQGQIEHSKIDIGSVKTNCKIKVDFSNSFQIVEMPQTAENVEIKANHSTMTLPNDSECSFNVMLTHGNFVYPNGNKIFFYQNTDTDESKKNISPIKKQYVGKIGSGNGAKIIIVSNFGDVNLK